MSVKVKLWTVYTFAKINARRFFRDRLAIFFTIIFPLVFLLIFGGIFGKRSNINFKVVILNQSTTQSAQQFTSVLKESKAFKISNSITDISAAKEKMNRGEVDATIILNETFGIVKTGQDLPSGTVEVLYSQNSTQAGSTLVSVLQGIIDGFNAQLVLTPTPFKVTGQATTDKGLSSFDYTFSGLLGFSILGIGIFGPMNVFPELKKQGILRRLHTTTLRVWQYFMSTAASQSLVGLLSFLIQILAAIFLFNLKIVGNYFELGIFLMFSTIMMLGIGLALGGWAKNERQVAPLGNLITFPMIFLSGTFFPRYLMPEWLQSVSSFIPLTPIIDGVRLIATEGKHLNQIGAQMGLIGIWMIVIYIIAFRVFRWE